MPYLDPVTDRAQSDIANRTAKAFLNVTDWLRIYGNQQFVALVHDLVNGVDVDLHALAAPAITTFPSATAINQLIENIELLHAAAGLPDDLAGLDALKHDWRAGATANAPDFEDANAWEAKLDVLRAALLRAAEVRVYAGVAASGQPRYWQHRWRDILFVDAQANPVRHARAGVAICGTGLLRENLFRRY